MDSRQPAKPLIFLKATLFGGVIFLLPVLLIGVLLGKGIGMAVTAGEPVFRFLPHTPFWMALIPILALIGLLLLALLAGLFARTALGQRLLGKIETGLFGGVPQYQMMKSLAEGMAQVESARGWTPVLVPAALGWRIGFIVETLPEGWASVFLPQAPSATVGEVLLLPADGLHRLQISVAQAASIIRNMGTGAANLLPPDALNIARRT